MKTIKKSDLLEASDTNSYLEFVFDQAEASGAPVSVAASKSDARPLILIGSQARSGGTLLGQLLDGHPAILTFPGELSIGYPGKTTWPVFDSNDTPARLFATLWQPKLASMAIGGFQKRGKIRADVIRHAFRYSPRQHFNMFVDKVSHTQRERRNILDAYFSSFFSSWKRQKGFADTKWIVAHCPNFASRFASVEGFFDDYVDGRLIVSIRHPADYVASLRAHTKDGKKRYGDLNNSIRLWNKSINSYLAIQKRWPERVRFLWFHNLVRAETSFLNDLAEWAGVPFNERLLNATFDGRNTSSNTNFVDGDPLNRRSHLSDDDRNQISEQTSKCMAQICCLVEEI